MYGDHLPTLGLTVEDVTNRYLFDTSYVIVDNIGLEKKDQTLCSYQIAAEVLDQLDIHEGTMMQYHQARRKTKWYLPDMELLQYDLLYGEYQSTSFINDHVLRLKKTVLTQDAEVAVKQLAPGKARRVLSEGNTYSFHYEEPEEEAPGTEPENSLPETDTEEGTGEAA